MQAGRERQATAKTKNKGQEKQGDNPMYSGRPEREERKGKTQPKGATSRKLKGPQPRQPTCGLQGTSEERTSPCDP